MKVRIDIDCTPEEARAFLGLPDVSALQAGLMKQVQDRMEAALASSSPEDLLKTWLPAGLQGMEAMQKMFWNAAGMSPEKDDVK